MVNVGDIKNVLVEVQKHYEKHINNKYVKNSIMKIDLSQTVIQNMNLVLSGNLVYIDSKGAIEDLYIGIKAVLDFILEMQQNVVPNMGSYFSNINLQGQQLSQNDRILSQMAIKNYPMNLKLFFDMVNKLFGMVNEFDKVNFSKDPAYKRMRNFSDIEKQIAELTTKFEKN